VTRAGVEARNIQVVAHLIAAAAILREESRGAHFRTDFPERDDARFRRSFVLGPGGEVGTLEFGATPPGSEPPAP
jgi:succinate dehydrogenase/fumarate reductase flavoprotein subunit